MKISRVFLMLILLLFASAVVFPASYTATQEEQLECKVEFGKQSNTVVGGLTEMPFNTPIEIWKSSLWVCDNPLIHNGMVTWEGRRTSGSPRPSQIFFYDGTDVHQLTDNDWYNYKPRIHNGMVTWYGYDGNDHEIFFYDGTDVHQLTNNGWSDSKPRIHNGMVTWYGWDGNDWEIFLYDGMSVDPLTDNDVDDYSPSIHNGMVTWYGYDGNDYEIFFYDGTDVHQLTNNDWSDTGPQIHNGMVTWYGYDGNDEEIFLFKGEISWMGRPILYQLTNNDYSDRPYSPYSPSQDHIELVIHNGMVTWVGFVDNGDGEIFLYDGTTVNQLTDNDWDEWTPRIHNGMVTWQGRIYDIETFLYDGVTVRQLTDNDWDDSDPDIHNGIVMWRYPYRIYILKFDFDPPVLDALEDMGYEYGTNGHSLTWNANDAYPEIYTVTLNGIEIASGPWSGESISIDIDDLPRGTHVYECTANDEAGQSTSDTVLVVVYDTSPEPEFERLSLKLSGSFDFLEKEKIHLQIAGLLTVSSTGEAVSGATVTFDVYGPEGEIILSDTLLEELPEAGVYIYRAPLTMKDMDLAKGIYWVYAQAETAEGALAVDMIQFHIDPPPEIEGDASLTVGSVGLGISAFAIAMTAVWRRRRSK
ncbi:MAG: hypothetical protein ACXADF_06440 [Candidatus Thorarchaeota archaeon]|jgi:hypothetical protein